MLGIGQPRCLIYKTAAAKGPEREQKGMRSEGKAINRTSQRRETRQESRERRARERRRNLIIVLVCAGLLVLSIIIALIAGAIAGNGEETNGTSSLAEPIQTGGTGLTASPAASISTPESTPLPSSSGPDQNAQLADPLLVLVNADTPLPEDWQVDLVNIGSDSQEQIDARAYDDLYAMTEAARLDGIWFWVTSAYRSVELQQEILDRKIEENMGQGMTREEAEADALHTIQKPGYSEHHTGLVVDFNDASDDFEATEDYAWLSQHAADYGFVQRYRRDKVDLTGIDNESWHYRYVGKEHAREMERLDMCLEEYVAYLKDRG